ncbi:MAG: hypothetical protein IPI66_08725 [Chitinophagaceae bacterium]|nr:hypothetical protein [Chitinophagaceae bacterium]
MRDFQLGLDVQYEPDALLEKIAENMKKLEQVACAMYRLISHHVKGTPRNMKVDPYTFDLNATLPAGEIELESEENMDESINKDVELMWFHPQNALVNG